MLLYFDEFGFSSNDEINEINTSNFLKLLIKLIYNYFYDF